MTEEILAGTVSPAEPTDAPVADAAGETKPQAKAPAAPPRVRLSDLKPGTQIKGVVKNIAQFGAFVDIGAEQDGLVHISELSENRVRRVEDVVKVGQEVEVSVLEVDANRRRISLSMKPRFDVYDMPADDPDEETLTPMQLAFARAQQKRDADQTASKNREKVRATQEDILNRTLRQHKDRK